MSEETVTKQEITDTAKKEAERRGCEVLSVVDVEDRTPPPQEFHGMNGQVVFGDMWGKWLVILYVKDRAKQETEILITVQQAPGGLYALPQ